MKQLFQLAVESKFALFQVEVKEIIFLINNYIHFSDKNITKMYNNKTEFSTPLSKSYRCAKEQSFNLLQDGTNVTIGNIELSHVQLEAFHKTMDDSFGAGQYLIMHLIQYFLTCEMCTVRLCTQIILKLWQMTIMDTNYYDQNVTYVDE